MLLLVVLLPAVLFTAALSPASAQELTSVTDPVMGGGEHMDLEIHFGFGGRFRPGYWTPVRVRVVNRGPATEGTLLLITRHGSPVAALSHTTTHSVKLHLPTGVAVTHEFVPLISNAYHPLRVEVRDARGEVAASTVLDLQNRAVSGTLIVALDPSGQEWAWLPMQLASSVSLRGEVSGTHVAYLRTPQSLPTSWIAYHGASAVAISGSFPMGGLSEAQTTALARWVEAGGRLIWSGGRRTEAARSSLAASHSPIRWTGITRRLPSPVYPSRYGPFPNAADIIVWDVETNDATILSDAGGSPLLLRKEIGKGSTVLTTFDPNELFLAGWESLGDLARDMVADAAALPAGIGEAEEAVWQHLERLQLPFPSRNVPAALIVIYTVASGAVLALGRRMKWSRLATTLAIATLALAVASVSALVLRPLVRRATYAVAEVAVSFVDADGTGTNWLFHGMMGQDDASWRVRGVPEGWTQAPANWRTMESAEADLRIDRVSPDAVAVWLPAKTFGRFIAFDATQIGVRSELILQSQQYHLSVENDTQSRMLLLYFVHPTRFERLGSIEPGGTVTYSYPATIFTSNRPSAEWIAQAVRTDIERHMQGSLPDGLPALVEQLVATRMRRGPAGRSLDDGFLIGLFESESQGSFEPKSNAISHHLFVMDVTL